MLHWRAKIKVRRETRTVRGTTDLGIRGTRIYVGNHSGFRRPAVRNAVLLGTINPLPLANSLLDKLPADRVGHARARPSPVSKRSLL